MPHQVTAWMMGSHKLQSQVLFSLLSYFTFQWFHLSTLLYGSLHAGKDTTSSQNTHCRLSSLSQLTEQANWHRCLCSAVEHCVVLKRKCWNNTCTGHPDAVLSALLIVAREEGVTLHTNPVQKGILLALFPKMTSVLQAVKYLTML